MLFSIKAAGAALLLFSAPMAIAQTVVAHFIVGNSQNFQPADWDHNIALAHEAGLDGFALNVAADGSCDKQIPMAYQAAERASQNGTTFKVFLQFDDCNGNWQAPQLTQTIAKYSGSPAQLKVGGKPLVSTFEGADAGTDWASVKSATGSYLVPDWTSKKGSNPGLFGVADGALSWDIWPNGASAISSQIDSSWTALLGPSKTYMMGVSPWLYTNLPQYGKNWVARGAGLWHARWRAAIAQKPPMVMVVTWNDFGESHYIGPHDDPRGWPQGSAGYVKGNDHVGWRATLPAYIAAYKAAAGAKGGAAGGELLAYAHTTNPVAPAGSCSDGGTVAQFSATRAPQVAVDAIDVYAVVNSPATVQVQVGTKNATFEAGQPGVNYFSVPLDGQTGAVSYALVRGGKTVAGGTEHPGISTDCSGYGGKVNYNAVTGVFKAVS